MVAKPARLKDSISVEVGAHAETDQGCDVKNGQVNLIGDSASVKISTTTIINFSSLRSNTIDTCMRAKA